MELQSPTLSGKISRSLDLKVDQLSVVVARGLFFFLSEDVQSNLTVYLNVTQVASYSSVLQEFLFSCCVCS